MWLLPTHNKVANLRRFVCAAREMGTAYPGIVIVNKSEWETKQAEYESVKPLMPANWRYETVDAECYGEAIRAMWPKVKDDPWIGLVADDLVPCTSNWDKILVADIKGWNIVSSNDGWQAPGRAHGAIVFSGEWARTMGGIFPPKLRHIFHDNWIETLGKETGCWQVRMDVMCKHLHEALQGIRGDTMNPESLLWKHDQAIFEGWTKDGKESDVQKIKELQKRHGVTIIQPDFKGVNLMIATPCNSGRYESSYLVSLFNTMRAMTENGVPTQLAEEKYTADIALARSKLFSAFLRSQSTHLLMIDDDMGWSLDAVYRLFAAKKDFIAIAGPKKRYPLSFAANFTDAAGNPVPLIYDTTSGTMEIGEIGAAFLLISRRCAEKLASSYPETLYVGVTGESEYAVFMPMVQNKRYYSEDFAFCKRWRALGEKCFMIPDVALTHTGGHQFSGAFSETAEKERAMRQAAA